MSTGEYHYMHIFIIFVNIINIIFINYIYHSNRICIVYKYSNTFQCWQHTAQNSSQQHTNESLFNLTIIV